MANIFYREYITPSTPSAVLQTQAAKGSPLTNAEGDYNLYAINRELEQKVDSNNPVFNGPINAPAIYMANKHIRKHAGQFVGAISDVGFKIGTYTRTASPAGDGRLVVFDLNMKMQKLGMPVSTCTSRILYQTGTSNSVTVKFWNDGESTASDKPVEVEVWVALNGDVTFFGAPQTGTTYDSVGYELTITASGDFDNFVQASTYTAKVTTGLTQILSTDLIERRIDKANITHSGNYNVSGSARRFTADFSNATRASRMLFSTSTANGASYVGVIPNGTGTISGVNLHNSSDVANSGFVDIVSSQTEVAVKSDKSGTGSYLPIKFYTGGNNTVQFKTDGVVDLLGTGGQANYSGWYTLGGRGIRKYTVNNSIEFLNQANTSVTHLFYDNGAFTAFGHVTAPSLSLSTALPISSGGTGAYTASTALDNLGGTSLGKTLFQIASAAAGRSALAVPVFDNTPKTKEFFQSTTIESGFYTNDGNGLLNAAGTANHLSGWWHVLAFYHDTNGYASQIAIELSDGNGARMYLRVADGTSWSEWSALGGQRVVNGGQNPATVLQAMSNDACVMWAGNNVRLPASPTPGDKVVVYKHGNAQCTVLRNGQNIMSLAEDCSIDYNNSTLTFTFLESGIGWSIA